MTRTLMRAMLVLAAFTVVSAGSVRSAHAIEGTRNGQSADLFPQYYTEPGYGGQVAQLYPSPRPTPPLVGQTWITYQPLLPQEFLYEHHRTYYRYNPGAGYTTTRVVWFHNPLLGKVWVPEKRGTSIPPAHMH